ncbi:MAG: hypothetical protein ACI9LX_003089 [Paraglaciecola sp.]|jgi:hypothetical protein
MHKGLFLIYQSLDRKLQYLLHVLIYPERLIPAENLQGTLRDLLKIWRFLSIFTIDFSVNTCR